MSVFDQIRNLVKHIPTGKISTYGSIAKIIGTTPRVVGWALRGNEDMSLPCHRVVKNGGVLASQFSLGNWPEQRRRLELEGLKFDGQKIINFSQNLIDLTKLSASA